MRIVDPPEGWKYGFPKEFTFTPPATLPLMLCQEAYEEEYSLALADWFILNGYPKKLIPLAIRYSRYWETEDKNSHTLP